MPPDDNAPQNQPVTPTADSDSLAGRLAGQSALENQFDAGPPPPTEPPSGGPPPPSEAITRDSISNIVTEALAPIRTELATTKMENAQLRGAMNIMARQSQAPPPVAAPPAGPPPRTDEQWTEALRTTPVTALREFIMEAIKPIRSEITGEVTRRTGEVAATVQQRDQIRSAGQQEINWVKEEFPIVKERADFNPQFYSDMETEWQQIVQRDGNVTVGQMREAASATNLKWSKSGKNPWQASAQNGSSAAGARPQEIRTVQRTNVKVNGSAGGGRQEGGKPTKISELGLSGEEQTAAYEVLRRSQAGGQPFTEADFVRNYLASQEEIPRFGE